MPHIIRDAEFHTSAGEGLWPGMWVHTWVWNHRRQEPSPLQACYLWRVEQHDGIMLLAGQGVDVLLPLTAEIADDCVLIRDSACDLLATCPAEWAALRKLKWGVYLDYHTSYYNFHLYRRLSLHYHRENGRGRFSMAEGLQYQLEEKPEILRSFLTTCCWRLKHPRYAEALASEQPREFWDWPNTPPLKQLHAMGVAAFKTVEGRVEIGPDGMLKATGRKAWDFPTEGEPE